jgi:predicted GNAT family acetyltransferase
LIDKDGAFMLSTGVKPEYKKHGVMASLIWKAIQEAAQYVSIFDFAGSMIPSIARYLISFSPKQEISCRIYHNRFKLIETLQIFQRKL